jgi:2-oxo-4-hydroxy-4-carboxy-5-ureidoimidazoline decarboxylase
VTGDEVHPGDGDGLASQLRRCCASSRWVAQVMASGPFVDAHALQRAGEDALVALPPAEVVAALQAEAEPEVHGADDGTRAAAATALRLYATHFGYPFVLAAGRIPADGLLMRVRIRLGNDEAEELRAATDELRRLVRSRLGTSWRESGAYGA